VSPELLVVVLAAGASRWLGTSKQLFPIDGEPLLRRQCRCALDAHIGRVLVILGNDADLHRRAISDLPIELGVNDNWQEGMAATLRHAVRIARQQRAATLVLPCDQYRVTPNDLQTLHDTWRPTPSAACVSRWHDYAGPPAILPIEYYGDVLKLQGDTGARALLYDGTRPRPLEVANLRATYDLDFPEDLAIAQTQVIQTLYAESHE